VTVKPYKEVSEKGDNEREVEAAQRFWDQHIARNDSIIVDLFHGQYKSTITCPECHRVSITYDPFTNVSIPIPDLSKVDIYVIPINGLKKNIKLSIHVSKEARFFDILHYINSNTNLDEKFTRVRCMIVDSNKLVKMARPDDYIVESSLKGYIFCNEIESIPDYVNIPVHVAVNGEFKSFPRLFTLKNSDDIESLKLKVYTYMRSFIIYGLNQFNEFECLIKTPDYDYDKFIYTARREYESLFRNDDYITVSFKEEILKDFPYELVVEKKNVFSQIDNLNFKNSESNRIVINITNMKFVEEKFKAISSCMSYASKDKSKASNLHDCLEHFRLTEKLEKDNQWYCNKCKKHQQAFKKLELFHTPKLLILHLKRFSYSSGRSRYRISAEKVDKVIDFPIEELDLSNYVTGPGSVNSKYELYAVSQHYGSTGGGHYTAICRNFGKWFNFNDSSVSSSSESNVVSSAAYLLFYRKKE
jgi:ubiquitin carboxyl-terminal hydrolase 4/11/15